MIRKARSRQRREKSLSRDRIIEESIQLLDSDGEAGLTFRALSERLDTGAGAIYWHIANKSDLLAAACDAIIARTMDAGIVGGTPKAKIRVVALSIFDTMAAHPWLGSALRRAELHSPLVQIFEPLGQQVSALGVPAKEQRATVGALLGYILGVAGQNAANGLFARTRGIDRSDFLKAVSNTWSKLDPDRYPFARTIARQLPAHDDRKDFLAGIDLLLRGIDSLRRD
jgi:AcrR family transcriptional regulator